MATQQEQIEVLASEAIAKFLSGPLAKEAETVGWLEPLHAYAAAMALYQAHLLTKAHPNDAVIGFDPDAIFGTGFTDKLARKLPCATYQLTQWQREMQRECAHGSIEIRVPQDHYRRLIAEGCAAQNEAATKSPSVE